jgi:hypothetical protein
MLDDKQKRCVFKYQLHSTHVLDDYALDISGQACIYYR